MILLVEKIQVGRQVQRGVNAKADRDRLEIGHQQLPDMGMLFDCE